MQRAGCVYGRNPNGQDRAAAGKGRYQETKAGDVEDAQANKSNKLGGRKHSNERRGKERWFRASKEETKRTRFLGQRNSSALNNFIPQATCAAVLPAAVHREALLERVGPGTGQQLEEAERGKCPWLLKGRRGEQGGVHVSLRGFLPRHPAPGYAQWGSAFGPRGHVHKQRENRLLPALVPTKLLGLLEVLPELVQFASRIRKL